MGDVGHAAAVGQLAQGLGQACLLPPLGEAERGLIAEVAGQAARRQAGPMRPFGQAAFVGRIGQQLRGDLQQAPVVRHRQVHALARRGADLVQQHVDDVLALGRGGIAQRPFADAVGQRLRQFGQSQHAWIGRQGGAGGRGQCHAPAAQRAVERDRMGLQRRHPASRARRQRPGAMRGAGGQQAAFDADQLGALVVVPVDLTGQALLAVEAEGDDRRAVVALEPVQCLIPEQALGKLNFCLVHHVLWLKCDIHWLDCTTGPPEQIIKVGAFTDRARCCNTAFDARSNISIEKYFF